MTKYPAMAAQTAKMNAIACPVMMSSVSVVKEFFPKYKSPKIMRQAPSPKNQKRQLFSQNNIICKH